MNLSRREIFVFLVIVLGVVVLGLVLLIVFGWLGGLGFHMMGPGMMGTGNLIFWLLLCLISVLIISLLVGIGLLFTTTRQDSAQRPAQETCPNCGRPVQSDWRICPNCGQPLKEETDK